MPRISFDFDSNAKSVAKDVKNLEQVLDNITRKGSGRRRAASGQSRTAIGEVAQQINRADLAKPGSQNVIRAANQAGLGAQLEQSAMNASTVLGGVLGTELQQGIGYIVDKNMRPIKQAIARLRDQAASPGTTPAAAANLTQMADDMQDQLTAYQKMAVSRSAALQSVAEPRVLNNLERVRAQYARMGVDVGSIGDLGKFAGKLSTISPAMAASVSTLTANMDSLDPQQYTKEFQKIATMGLKQVDDQKRELTAAIQRQASKSNRGIGTSFTRVFEQRFGKVADFLSGAATFDKTSIPNQMAMSVFRDQIKATAPGRLMSGLDARNIPQLQALANARAGGDPAAVATAMTAAEKAVNRRVRSIQTELTKLTKIATATGDADLKAAITQLRVTMREAQQKLVNQINGAQRTIQTGMFNQMDAAIKAFSASVKTSGGNKAAITTRDGLADYNNRLTGYIGQLFQSQNKAFANIKFDSLGGKSFAELFPGKGGGVGTKANVLTSQILAPTGFFRQNTAEGRMSALNTAIDAVEPTLARMGLSGKELTVATEQLRNTLAQVYNAYKPVISTAQQLNAVQMEAARAQALRMVREGNFAGAQAAVANLDRYTTTTVPTSRRNPVTGADLIPQTADQLSPGMQTNYAQNADVVQGAIATSEERANRGGLFQRLGQFAGRALSIFGGLQFAVGGAANAISNLVEQANGLDRAASTVNALSGSFEGFNQVLTLAATQQAKFGGTLQENLQGFTSLIPVSKRYGADLKQLDNIARRLAVVDPVQGFQGAAIALKEFFAGDIISLSRRFEIDRKTLNSIKDAGDKLQQLQKLDEVLADLGISNAVLESRTQTTAATYDRFGATLSNFTTIVGKGLQVTFEGFVDGLIDVIDYTDALNRQIAEEQAYINLSTNIERVARSFYTLQNATTETTTAIDRFSGEAVSLSLVLDKNAKSGSQLVEEWNSLITELNRLRIDNNQPLIQLFTNQDREVINELVEISNTTGIPVLSLLENRNALTGGSLTTQERLAQTVNQTPGFERFLWSTFRIGSDSTRQADDLVNLIRPGTERIINTYVPTNLQNQVQNTPGFGGFFQNMFPAGLLTDQTPEQNLQRANAAYLSQLEKQTSQINTNTAFFERQAEQLQEETGINYSAAMVDYANQLQSGALTQEEVNAIVLEMIRLNKQLLEVTDERIRYESDYITQNVATISSFGGQALNEVLVGKLDEITKKNAETAFQILSQTYGAMGGGASKTGMSTELQRVVKLAEEYYGITREQLYYQSQLEKRQARITLEGNKSVSAYTALRYQMTGMQVPLQEAVRLAMEFSSSIEGMVGSMLSGFDPAQQLQFYMSEFSNPNTVNNQDAVLKTTESALGALQAQEQQRLDEERAARKETKDLTEQHNEELADLAKEYEEDRMSALDDYENQKIDLLDDYEKDKLKLLEDYEEKKLKLLQESEVSKRENRGGFYDMLMRTEGLTPEQMQQASADYERLFQEASDLRNKGEFGKAAEVLAAGTQEITNRVKNQEEQAKDTEKIKKSEEDLVELRKDLAKAGSKEERDRIEKRIKEVEDDIARTKERIDRYNGAYALIAQADAERVKQARESEEQITKDLNKNLDDRAQKYKDDLADAETKLKDSLAEREKQYRKSLERMNKAHAKAIEKQGQKEDEATKAQIVNMEDVVKLRQAGYLAINAARLASEGASQVDIDKMLTEGMAPIKQYFTERGTEASKIILEALDTLDTLPPSLQQTFDPLLGSVFGVEGGGNPFIDEMYRAGIPAGSLNAQPGIDPFQAAILNNNTAVMSNTTALDTLTQAIKNFNIFQIPGLQRGF